MAPYANSAFSSSVSDHHQRMALLAYLFNLERLEHF